MDELLPPERRSVGGGRCTTHPSPRGFGRGAVKLLTLCPDPYDAQFWDGEQLATACVSFRQYHDVTELRGARPRLRQFFKVFVGVDRVCMMKTSRGERDVVTSGTTPCPSGMGISLPSPRRSGRSGRPRVLALTGSTTLLGSGTLSSLSMCTPRESGPAGGCSRGVGDFIIITGDHGVCREGSLG